MTTRESFPVSWLFFADEKRPMSMRMVLGMRLAETDPVVIIETPVSVRSTLRIPPLEQRASRIEGAVAGWHYHPLHFPERVPGLSNAARGLNLLLLQRELRRLAPESTMRIACYDSPWQHYLPGKLQEHRSIYLAIDDRTRTVYGDPIAGELEAEKCLLSKVDGVICVSEFLAETLSERMSGRIIPVSVLPNGYNERLFYPGAHWDRPLAVADVPSPTILVAGHVSRRIDWEGIAGAAKLRPEWTWLFVGPADLGLREKIEAIGKSENASSRLVWKPPIPLEEMPALISHCDACAVPYVLNPFTLASSPLKGVEYLAMGLPVLSTRVPALLRYGGVIEWVEQNDAESYAQALDRLKSELRNSASRMLRKLAVSGDSHEARVRQFRQILTETILGNKIAVNY